MSDGRRRRNRKPREERERDKLVAQQRTILIKRSDEPIAGCSTSAAAASRSQELQPKILLKIKTEKPSELEAIAAAEGPVVKTIIVTRSDAVTTPAASPNLSKEATNVNINTVVLQQSKDIIEPVAQMTRPATVISSTGFINAGARKTCMASNTDFLVVGVIGTQAVGKSTICNLLANEQDDFDYVQKIFVEEDGIFPTKLKPHKFTARSRTESTHMFITKDRLILLDSPPVLCNSYKKDMITNEMDDLRQIITFLSVCHLLIVVHDDLFVNMSFMRLLHFAELMKPSQDNKILDSEYFPNLLFIKNRAKRQDFVPGKKNEIDLMLQSFFKDSQLRIFKGQSPANTSVTATDTKSKKLNRNLHEGEKVVNSFLLPEVKRHGKAAVYHASYANIIEDLRKLVFMTPRCAMNDAATELTEAAWFDLLSKVSQSSKHFFFDNYEKIQRKHLELLSINGNTGAAGGAGSNRETKSQHENWRE